MELDGEHFSAIKSHFFKPIIKCKSKDIYNKTNNNNIYTYTLYFIIFLH